MTREDYINNLQSMIDDAENMGLYDEDVESLQVAIKALEQEPILDKIRAEITNIPITDTDGNNNNWYREPQAIIKDVLRIIDKYKAESEE